MNRTRYIPSIVMLSAALVSCVATIFFRYSTKDIMIIVLITSIVFLMIGQIIRRIAEKYLIISTMTETELEAQENKEGEDNEEAKDGENKDSNSANTAKQESRQIS